MIELLCICEGRRAVIVVVVVDVFYVSINLTFCHFASLKCVKFIRKC